MGGKNKSAVKIDYKKEELENLLTNMNSVYYLRGYFIEKSIQIEYAIIQILSSFYHVPSRDKKSGNNFMKFMYSFMGRELNFRELTNLFSNEKLPHYSSIQKKLKEIKLNNNNKENIKQKLVEIIEFRNKIAHYIYVNSEKSFFNDKAEVFINEEYLKEIFEIFYSTLEDLEKILKNEKKIDKFHYIYVKDLNDNLIESRKKKDKKFF